jgi:DNA replication licensing factor MCM6
MFQEFLQNFTYHGELEKISAQERLTLDYMLQISTMIQNNRSTIYVNFGHVMDFNSELAEAIELEFYRFEPYVRHAVQDLVMTENQGYVFDLDKGQRELFVSFYNFPRVERIRAMGTEKIGRLTAISGTVTRSSEVRPELLYGSFLCKKCGAAHLAVEQQFQYTEPQMCKNPQCKQTGDFQILLEKSAFVDWQRLRVQENADEIPPGSMPRCVDVICRNEVVETAKAGDKVVLTGAVAVIPDTTGLARVGESTVAGKVSGRGEQFAEGVGGLKKLGVKEMTYKMIFVACNVQHADQKSNSKVCIIYIGVVSVYIKYNCVYYCDTCYNSKVCLYTYLPIKPSSSMLILPIKPSLSML